MVRMVISGMSIMWDNCRHVGTTEIISGCRNPHWLSPYWPISRQFESCFSSSPEWYIRVFLWQSWKLVKVSTTMSADIHMTRHDRLSKVYYFNLISYEMGWELSCLEGKGKYRHSKNCGIIITPMLIIEDHTGVKFAVFNTQCCYSNTFGCYFNTLWCYVQTLGCNFNIWGCGPLLTPTGVILTPQFLQCGNVVGETREVKRETLGKSKKCESAKTRAIGCIQRVPVRALHKIQKFKWP